MAGCLNLYLKRTPGPLKICNDYSDYLEILYLSRIIYSELWKNFILFFQGEDNDNDKYHVAQSWVTVKLRDINDNKPIFEKANIEALVRENARVGKTLERFRATDPDQGGKSQVRYEIDRSSG